MESPARPTPPENRPPANRSPEHWLPRTRESRSSAPPPENRPPEERLARSSESWSPAPPPENRLAENRPPEQRVPRSLESRSPAPLLENRLAENRQPEQRLPRSPERRSPAPPLENLLAENRPPEQRVPRFPEYRSPAPPLENLLAENRPPEQRVPRLPEYRSPAPPLENLLAENRPPEQRFPRLPEYQSPALRLAENRSPEKTTPAIENHPPDRDDLALSPVVAVNRSSRDEMGAVTKTEVGGLDRRSRVVSSIVRRSKKEAMVRRAELGFRVLGLLFCLVSFSVMAADKTQGWAGDSFERYKEYRYCISVTIIGFVYAGFQAFAQSHHLITGKHLIRHPMHCYFDFSMDQILAYLLMSASSSAATRTDDWVLNWGEDEFTKMASASIGMSFLAFVAFAFSALISGYKLCNRSP
ncbi:CASP-like protein 4A3 [Magnolia sinica]|uniref:CASP-like protein 4A3 n=1 Tax=Magnolia sinica TaxID=86752 RepID=UPI0026598E42|nr:CASP-like protein 4A3 [Magnolia sinica]